MAGYTIRIKASVEKDIAALPRDLTVRILQGIEDLSEAPLPFGVRRLSGAENLYRVRVGIIGSYMPCTTRSRRSPSFTSATVALHAVDCEIELPSH